MNTRIRPYFIGMLQALAVALYGHLLLAALHAPVGVWMTTREGAILTAAMSLPICLGVVIAYPLRLMSVGRKREAVIIACSALAGIAAVAAVMLAHLMLGVR